MIPPQYQLAARVAVLALLAALCFATGWTVNGWRLERDVADVKAAHQQAVADAGARALAAQEKAQADHEALAGRLADQSAAYHEDLTRREREIDILRPSVVAGTRVVRVAATCPAAADPVPEAAPGGRLDPAAGAFLAPADGQRVLDLRAGIVRKEGQLAACQAAVKCLTGQGACPAKP
jgi:hypothetical protein